VNKGETINSKVLGSPNKIIWEYCECLRNMVRDIQESNGLEQDQRKALPCIFMGIAIIETFLNVYFRQLIEEAEYKIYRKQILRELDETAPLDLKIKVWPKRFFSHEMDFSCGIGQRFMALKKLRNNLMHFKSSYETVDLPGMQIQGVADISSYENLDRDIAWESLRVAEEMIAEIFRLRRMSPDEIKLAMQSWTGKVPE